MTEQADELPPICILAGGLGTRLGAISAEVPKALVEVAGRPFIFHQLELLAANGARRIVICVGHLGSLIESCVGPARYGLEIAYSSDAPGLEGTLGAIRRALPLLGERFLYLYGDTYLRIDYRGANTAWNRSGAPALMCVLHNAGRWGASNAAFDGRLVTAYDKEHPPAGLCYIDYGLGGLTNEALELAAPGARDLAGLHQRLAAGSALCGYEATERFYEIGTPEALAETGQFLASLSRPIPDRGAPWV